MSSDRDVAFPTLTSAELQALSTRGTRREVRTGEILYQEGDRDHSFFVVLEGAVEVLDNSAVLRTSSPSTAGDSSAATSI